MRRVETCVLCRDKAPRQLRLVRLLALGRLASTGWSTF
jgi:hypothetical protein